jgi:hypothetical protein
MMKRKPGMSRREFRDYWMFTVDERGSLLKTA